MKCLYRPPLLTGRIHKDSIYLSVQREFMLHNTNMAAIYMDVVLRRRPRRLADKNSTGPIQPGYNRTLNNNNNNNEL